MDAAGVDIVCLNGVVVPTTLNVKGNDEVEKAFREYPNRIVGFGAVYPGRDPFERSRSTQRIQRPKNDLADKTIR